jgi:GNAT superfamily N-acetyltransferase
MLVAPLSSSDLQLLPALQPQDWGDITNSFTFYIYKPFCFPIGIREDERLVGIGAVIFHGTTAWLCHIIVHPEFRNRGLGKLITGELIAIAKQDPRIETLLLLATKLGAPVYQKCGFEAESDYVFYKGSTFEGNTVDDIVACTDIHFSEVLQLDRKVSGEDRAQLLEIHRDRCWIKTVDGKVDGFYFPSLGDGLIIAKGTATGEALMRFRGVNDGRFVIPEQNVAAADFLLRNNFEPFLRGTRMRLGRKIDWHPEGLFNRIGGNLG